MSHQEKSSGVPYPVKLIIGIGMMVGGFWLSQHGHEVFPFQETLAAQGIPLDLGITVAVIGVFLILFPVIKSFYLNPLVEAIHERNSSLERTFTEAETLRSEMTTMRSDYERRLVETEARAREQIQSQISEAQRLRQTLMAEAADKADSLVREAQQKIAQERDSIINDLRVSVVDLTLAATEKVLGENMDTDRNRRLVNEFIDKVEVAH